MANCAVRTSASSLLLNVLDDSDFRQRTLLIACNKSDMMANLEKNFEYQVRGRGETASRQIGDYPVC